MVFEETEKEIEIRIKGGRIFPVTPIILYLTDPKEYYRKYHLRKKHPFDRAQAIGLAVHRILQIAGTNRMSFSDPNKLRAFIRGVYPDFLATDKESQRVWEFLKKQNALEGIYNVLNKYFDDFSLKDVVATEAEFLFPLDNKNFIKSRFDQIRKVEDNYCIVDLKFKTSLPVESPNLFVIMEMLIQQIGFCKTRGLEPVMILHDLTQSKRFIMNSGAIDQKKFVDMLLLAARGIKGKMFFPNQMALVGFENPWQEANSILKELDLEQNVHWQEEKREKEGKKTEALICGDHLKEMTYDNSLKRWLCPQCLY